MRFRSARDDSAIPLDFAPVRYPMLIFIFGKERVARLGSEKSKGCCSCCVVYPCNYIYFALFLGPSFCFSGEVPLSATCTYPSLSNLRCGAGVVLVPLLYFAFDHPPVGQLFLCTPPSERPCDELALALFCRQDAG